MDFTGDIEVTSKGTDLLCGHVVGVRVDIFLSRLIPVRDSEMQVRGLVDIVVADLIVITQNLQNLYGQIFQRSVLIPGF